MSEQDWLTPMSDQTWEWALAAAPAHWALDTESLPEAPQFVDPRFKRES